MKMDRGQDSLKYSTMKSEVEVLEGYRLRDPDNGLIMPWYTWPCLEWLNGLDLKGKRVFEYGLGDSTLWFMHKGANCYGVDHSIYWWDLCRKYNLHKCGFDFSQVYQGAKSYCERPKFYPLFDMIVIDGIFRDECTEYALKYLKPGGYLIIDNFHQPSVEPNIWTETDRLIKGMPITIYKQPNHYDWQTAVITKI